MKFYTNLITIICILFTSNLAFANWEEDFIKKGQKKLKAAGTAYGKWYYGPPERNPRKWDKKLVKKYTDKCNNDNTYYARADVLVNDCPNPYKNFNQFWDFYKGTYGVLPHFTNPPKESKKLSPEGIHGQDWLDEVYKGMPKNVRNCVDNYEFWPRAGLGLGAGVGVLSGIGLTVGGIFTGSLFATGGMAAIPIVGMLAVGLPLAYSYKRSHQLLMWAAKGNQIGKVSPTFAKAFKKRDRKKGDAWLMQRQRSLFSKKSMKKLCEHPLYDYLTLRRKLRNGSL